LICEPTRWISVSVSRIFRDHEAAYPTKVRSEPSRGAGDMDDVEIVDYDPRWPSLFDEEAERLRAILNPTLIVGLVHFGSTAVPGLSAKPIIDILIVVRSLAGAQATFVEALRALDYVYWADNPKKDRMFFVKGMPPFGSRRSHHVHATELHGEMWQRLAFRDYLRAHPKEAAAYARLKRRLAIEHRTDREAYTDAKSAYVETVMRKAIKSGSP
jgi:GrpB-like predicted nucleotidyltransferase (UPF0157 family)